MSELQLQPTKQRLRPRGCNPQNRSSDPQSRGSELRNRDCDSQNGQGIFPQAVKPGRYNLASATRTSLRSAVTCNISAALWPLMGWRTSGAISAKGTRTNLRWNMRGWGTCSSGELITASS